MNIIRLTEEHKEQYEQFVAAHPSGSFLQSWSWGEFQTTQGKEAVRYGIFGEDGLSENGVGLVGTVQLLQTKIPKLPGVYLYAPYGPLLNVGVEETARELISKIKTDFSKAWFIRIEPKDEMPIDGKPSVHIQPGSTLVTDLTLTEEELLTGMHNKTRYNIKVATKHGVSVNSTEVAKEDAIALLSETSERQKYKSYSSAYYKNLMEFFAGKENADCTIKLYEAIYEGAPIASAIMIDHSTTRTYLFGGSDNSKRNLMAPYALHWQAMRDAKQVGFVSYDWWGIETATGATPGFVQFKLRWGGTQKFYAGSRDIVLNSTWYIAYNALRKVNRFF